MTINLSPLLLPIFLAVCFAAYGGIIIVLMVLKMRSGRKYAKRIQDAQARGAFDDMNTRKPRYRWLAATALVSMLGFVVTLGILFLQFLHVIALPIEFILTAFGIFGCLGATAGTLMQREIDRRL